MIDRSANCSLSVVSIGEYHTGVNARKRKKHQKAGLEKTPLDMYQANTLPVVGEIVNDSLPVVESESSFSHGKYLLYEGGGDRCKSMNHYLWSFLCALGEALQSSHVIFCLHFPWCAFHSLCLLYHNLIILLSSSFSLFFF